MGYMLPLLTEKSLANQRDVVRNERRQNYDNVPYGKERFVINRLLYAEGHPYRYLTIGRHEDLADASLDDVKNFFRKWYVPVERHPADRRATSTCPRPRSWSRSGSAPSPRSPRPRTGQVPPTPDHRAPSARW